jgi:phosphoribosyl 1,2-cyclic phosphate phosphodiesterase
VRYCLQTHAHSDHLDPAHFLNRSAEYGVRGAPRLHFYASGATARRAVRWFEAEFPGLAAVGSRRGHTPPPSVASERLNLEVHWVEALQSFTVGPYRVTALPANHDPSVEPLLYAIEAAGRRLFYGVDTAALPEDAWRAFHRLGLRFDVVILDHTYGPDSTATDHLNARQFAEHAARLREEGLLADGARILAHHIAHETNPPHPELAAFAAQHGYEVAHDGLTV